MTLSNDQLDELLTRSSPSEVRDAIAVRAAVARAVSDYPARKSRRRRAVVAGSIVGGLLVVGSTAATLPSIFGDGGPVDYQSSQQYTVDGRGPFQCDFAFRVDPPSGGVTLEPSSGGDVASFEEIQEFVQTHDWKFDDEPMALTTPADAERRDLSVISTFIHEGWTAELEAAHPDWGQSVGSISGAGKCASVVDGSAP